MDQVPADPTQPAPNDPAAPLDSQLIAPPPLSEAAKPKTNGRKNGPRPDGANVKETLESILVAFILAFIFRCFVVEAFVIPTGSMAPTLLGAHSRYQCPDCGYRFDVNYSSPDRDGHSGSDDIDIPDRVQPISDGKNLTNVVYDDIHCPNCGLRLPPEENPPIWYGDRILVLKYLYLIQSPHRWDVVVFKSPTDPRLKDYSENFIKRLIGTPGETIMVLDGDIYVKAKGESVFKVQTKTPAAQDALWRILYDNDFHPEGQTVRRIDWKQPWQPVAGKENWKTDLNGGRVFQFNGVDTFGTLNFNAEANRGENKNSGFIDWIAYDQRHSTQDYSGYRRESYWPGEFPVGDLKVDLYYSRTQGAGPLQLQLTKLDDTFTAEILPDSVRLIHESNGKIASRELTASLPGSNGPMHIEFSNVDYQVTLRIDGRNVLQTTPADYAPNIEDLQERQEEWQRFGQFPSRIGTGARHDPPFPAPKVSITARKQNCEISHLSLWRDAYYTPILAGNRNSLLHWGNPQTQPNGNGGPITLGDDEYFVMGDNSPLSFDGRFWPDSIHLKNEDLQADSGRVPGRFLLGRAFFVYWPAGYRPMERAPGLIPNVGQMRFIR